MNRILIFISFIFIFSCKDRNSFEELLISAINKVSPSVVSISIESLTSKDQIGFGAGIIVADDGYIITNSHVIDSGEINHIYITLSGGDKFPAQIIGIDMLTDIALLKINKTGLEYVALSNSNEVVRGQSVIALGNPHNLFSISNEPTATTGIISGKNVNFGLRKSGHVYQNMIQTDATINRGNSGGPLINLSGDVIGINTFVVADSNNSSSIGFSIPVDRVIDIMNDLKDKGMVNRSWFTGITIREIDQKYKDYFNISVDNGVIVTDVERKSPGSEAGVLLKDIIYKVNNKIVNSALDIEEVLDEGYFKTNDEVDLLLIRNNNPIKLKLKLIDPYN
jgi:serine protease Do